MDVIALRKESGSVTGSVHLNGFEQERTSFLRSSGYVEQFDVQSPELTVRETVAFSARLRLDSNHPELKEDEDKLRFVDSILKLLELINIEKVQVGSYDEGGLSFEQRKRLAIAVELAGSPSILFLDEVRSEAAAHSLPTYMSAFAHNDPSCFLHFSRHRDLMHAPQFSSCDFSKESPTLVARCARPSTSLHRPYSKCL
jgi:ABC-type lipoprotein export system ATPase subunit